MMTNKRHDDYATTTDGFKTCDENEKLISVAESHLTFF